MLQSPLDHIPIPINGKNIYAIFSALDVDNFIVVFNRDSLMGSLQFMESHEDEVNGIIGMRQLRDCMISPDGKFVYVCASNDKKISCFEILVETGINKKDHLQKNNVVLISNSNQFSATKTIQLHLKKPERISIQVQLVSGKTIYVQSDINLTAGAHSFMLPAQNLSSGIYLINLTVDNNSWAKKVVW